MSDEELKQKLLEAGNDTERANIIDEFVKDEREKFRRKLDVTTNCFRGRAVFNSKLGPFEKIRYKKMKNMINQILHLFCISDAC